MLNCGWVVSCIYYVHAFEICNISIATGNLQLDAVVKPARQFSDGMSSNIEAVRPGFLGRRGAARGGHH
jgi:hypothetical protein